MKAVDDNCVGYSCGCFLWKIWSFCCKTSVKRKATISLVVFGFCFFNLNAQKESTVKLKMETGILWDWVDGRTYLSGSFLYIEPKLKTSKNAFIGLRIGAAHNTQRVQTTDATQFSIDNYNDRGNGTFSFIPTFDRCFGNNNKYQPYIGVGLGYYFLTTSKDVFINNDPTNEAFKAKVNNQIGFLLRSGFTLYNLKVGRVDLSNVVVGVEFNYIPVADVEISSGERVGTINASNVALSIGYVFGNKKN